MDHKPKSLFDHINALYEDQRITYFEDLTDSDKKSYDRYMINRFLSMNPNQLPYVNHLQKYSVDPKTHYLFFSQVLPRGKQYNKYIKKTKEEKYEGWLVDIIVRCYNVSKNEAIDYLDIFYKQDKEALKQLCQLYGVEDKQLKKAKL
jgi:hypothetical protein